MSTLYVFGDSWPAGSDLDDVVKQGFPYLIAQKNNYKLDNIYACQMTCECDFPQSEFLSESHIQLEKITDDQLKSIMRYYMKHY